MDNPQWLKEVGELKKRGLAGNCVVCGEPNSTIPVEGRMKVKGSQKIKILKRFICLRCDLKDD